jgi:hypothetical protein
MAKLTKCAIKVPRAMLGGPMALARFEERFGRCPSGPLTHLVNANPAERTGKRGRYEYRLTGAGRCPPVPTRKERLHD